MLYKHSNDIHDLRRRRSSNIDYAMEEKDNHRTQIPNFAEKGIYENSRRRGSFNDKENHKKQMKRWYPGKIDNV